MNRFESLLQQLSLTKAAFAKSIRVQPGTVYRWKSDSDVPAVVMKYLEQLGKEHEKG
ncbi:helix-turn-helix domain-containing protein [Bradyrhizobium sp.]|jgi:DNA-binding XRE family transcriptional regulator